MLASGFGSITDCVLTNIKVKTLLQDIHFCRGCDINLNNYYFTLRKHHTQCTQIARSSRSWNYHTRQELMLLTYANVYCKKIASYWRNVTEKLKYENKHE